MSGTAPYHNYHVRIFGGIHTYYTPISNLSLSHLNYAMNIIDQYEVVILLDKFEEQKVQLSSFFGWNLRMESSISNRDSKKLTTVNYEALLSESSIEMLREVNYLDILFYNHSTQIAHNLTECAKRKCKKVL
jgi:hypothetical protein